MLGQYLAIIQFIFVRNITLCFPTKGTDKFKENFLAV